MRNLQSAPVKSDDYVLLAKLSAEYFVKHGRLLPQDAVEEGLNIEEGRAGVFVSCHKEGALRGCIGTIFPVTEGVKEEIVRNAVYAVAEDPRFPPVSLEELPRLKFKVDVLTPPEKTTAAELDPKEYGVIVSAGRRKGLLLPDLEGVDTVETQLAIALSKGGINAHEQFDIERFKVVRHE